MLDRKQRLDALASPFEKVGVVQGLAETETQLAGFVGLGEALDLNDSYPLRRSPREIEEWIGRSR